jgi:phosphate starvation-inducible PhoH-like protein
VVRQLTLGERGLEALYGSFDRNLKRLEQAFGLRIAARGREVTLEGAPAAVQMAETVLSQLSRLADTGYSLREGDVATAVRVLRGEPGASLREHFTQGRVVPSGRKQVFPKSRNQRSYVEMIRQKDLVFAIGPAGTGKTYLAVAMALSYLSEKRVERIILVRPAVEAGEKLGFLPGDLVAKVDPYLRPLYDAIFDLSEKVQADALLSGGIIEVAPLAFMRGRTLNDCFVILDEAQNVTREQMKMFLTRCGFNSKAVVTGDITQIDLPAGKPSGLVEVQHILSSIEGIGFVYFDERDVVRHPLVQSIIKAYEAYQNGDE